MWIFVEVGLGLKVDSVPIVSTSSSYKTGGVYQLGAGTGATGGGTTPAIGVSPYSNDAI